MGKEWQKRTKALILRSAILKHGNINVKTSHSRNDENTPSGSGNSAPGSSTGSQK